MPARESVEIKADAILQSIEIKQSIENNQSVISISDINSQFKVLYKGVDVFEKYFI